MARLCADVRTVLVVPARQVALILWAPISVAAMEAMPWILMASLV